MVVEREEGVISDVFKQEHDQSVKATELVSITLVCLNLRSQQVLLILGKII